ncbi:cytochrome c [Salipiger sp. PrR002]|uniref:cytochrome c n=1 Tax=Salipiger sp. PrR002 TaxID=2706489 RepID=UPI0034CFED8A
MYLNECASCHGDRLEGESGWQPSEFGRDVLAPPLDNSGHAWQHADRYLIEAMMNVSGSMKGHVEGGFSKRYEYEDYEALLNWMKSHWSRSHRSYQRRLNEVSLGKFFHKGG